MSSRVSNLSSSYSLTDSADSHFDESYAATGSLRTGICWELSVEVLCGERDLNLETFEVCLSLYKDNDQCIKCRKVEFCSNSLNSSGAM